MTKIRLKLAKTLLKPGMMVLIFMEEMWWKKNPEMAMISDYISTRGKNI